MSKKVIEDKKWLELKKLEQVESVLGAYFNYTTFCKSVAKCLLELKEGLDEINRQLGNHISDYEAAKEYEREISAGDDW